MVNASVDRKESWPHGDIRRGQEMTLSGPLGHTICCAQAFKLYTALPFFTLPLTNLKYFKDLRWDIPAPIWITFKTDVSHVVHPLVKNGCVLEEGGARARSQAWTCAGHQEAKPTCNWSYEVTWSGIHMLPCVNTNLNAHPPSANQRLRNLICST